MFFSFYDKDDFEEGTFDILYTQFSDCASIEYCNVLAENYFLKIK